MLRGTGGDHVVVAMNLVHVRRENGREEFHPFQMKPSFSLYIISLSIISLHFSVHIGWVWGKKEPREEENS